VSKAGYDGRAADARIPAPRPNPNFRPNESQRFFETFLVILLALASWWAHLFESGRGRYRNKLLNTMYSPASLAAISLMRSVAASKSVEDAIQTMRLSGDFLKMSKPSHMRTIPNQGGNNAEYTRLG